MCYKTELTDCQWQYIVGKLQDKRKRKHSLRSVWNAISYLVRSGCQWRLLPAEYPPWQSVYYYFSQWYKSGVYEEIMADLNIRERRRSGRKDEPSLGIIDSQSVKTNSKTAIRGYDGVKKLTGRKRHIVVDTLGLILSVVVHTANITDRTASLAVLQCSRQDYPSVRDFLADSVYNGPQLRAWLQEHGCRLEAVQKKVSKNSPKGFLILPKRWIVERTFGWFSRYRRLAKDYEVAVDSSVAIIQLSMIARLLKKLF